MREPADDCSTPPDEDEDDYGPHGEDVDALARLAEREGLGGVRVAATLVEEALASRSPAVRFGQIAVALVIAVVIFVRLIPRLTGAEYGMVFSRLLDLDWAAVAGLSAFWLFTMWTYAGVMTTSLPGLTRVPAMVLNFSGSALANLLPFGGAAGVATTYAQGMSWGFDPPSLTLSILVTGVWNVFAKLGLPILVLFGLLATNQSSEGLSAPGLIGFAALVGAVGGLVMLFRSDHAVRAAGSAVQACLDAARRIARRRPGERPRHSLPDRILAFRHRTSRLVRERWHGLTAWMVAYKASQALLLLLCAKAVGVEDVGWIQMFAVFAFGELLTTIPVTPSGLGFVEGGSTHLMVAFGADPDAALAAVLLYRLFTYMLEIPLGALGWLTWATHTSWRRPLRRSGPVP